MELHSVQSSRITRFLALLTLLATNAAGHPASAQGMACNPRTGCSLQDSGPIVATHDGQIIQGLRIDAMDEPGILVHNLANVVIRNVEIVHEGAPGISCDGSPRLSITNVSITRLGSDDSSIEENNIHAYLCNDLRVRHARLTSGSSGVYMLRSRNAHLSYIEGYNFLGPNPRGQLAQFDRSSHCVLENFSANNDPDVSKTEDIVSVYFGNNCTVRRGLLVGNNSPWGVGVMFEHSRHGLIERVDTVAQANGSFSAYPGHDITFRRTRARDNICGNQGRGRPRSRSLIWAGSRRSTKLRIEASRYFNACNPSNIVWAKSSFDVIEIREGDFSPRSPIVNHFAWEAGTSAGAEP